MRVITFLLAFLTLSDTCSLFAQIRITYLDLQNQEIKIKNLSDSVVDVSSFSLCQNGTSIQLDTSLTDLEIPNGQDFDSIAPNGFVLFTWSLLADSIGDIWISAEHNFCGNTSLFVDYVQYGAGGQTYENSANSIGAWEAGNFLDNGTTRWLFMGDQDDFGRQFWQPYVEGCMDPTACNYNDLATVNFSCAYIQGCTDTAACNYDILAQCDNGTCITPDSVVHIPDTVFKAILLEYPPFDTINSINTNNDNEIQGCEAFAYTLALDVTNINNTAPYIHDLTGIAAFKNITSLAFVNQEVSFLDLSHNQKLEVINGFDNQLTSLILGANDSLSELNCQNNLLTSLDVSGCASLRQILCDFNPIEQLNLTYNPLVEILECNNTALTALDLTPNTQLTSVICNNTAIEQIELPATDSLQTLQCNNANLQSLDLTPVNFLDSLNCTNNPDLTCIQVLNVDSANAEVNWLKDTAAYYNSSCAYGCDDVVACNYDSLAGINDGSCDYAACLDSTACNYDALAICGDSTLCVFLAANAILDCEGTCMNDDDGDGICNELEANCADSTACNYALNGDASITCYYPGCTNIFACNYDSGAACNDGSCTFDGCTDSTACNFNPNAGCDDGSCLPSGCNIISACNYVPFFCNNNTCVFPGCTDALACNYQPQAGCDNGSCVFPGCTSMAACNYDSLAGCDDNSCVFPGCTDTVACNFLPTAGCSDTSCVYPGCNDALACNFNPIAGCNDGSCGYYGCTDQGACNYDPQAACNDGSCVLGYCCTNPLAVNYLFPSNDSGVVCLYSPVIFLYHDANGDNTYNAGELGLPNRPVRIQTGNEDLLVYTNGSGYIQYLTEANTTLDVSLEFPAGDNWSGPSDIFTISNTDSLYLPLMPDSSGEMQFTPFTGFPSGLDCNLGYHGGVVVYNGLDEAVGLTMTIDISDLLSLGFEPTMENPFETESYSVQSGNTLIWPVVELLQPGQMRILTFNLLGPGTVSPGDSTALNYAISYTSQSNGTVNESIVHWVEQTCVDEASDIGIIPAPIGLYEPHYVLNGTEISFFINFAYDGNPERSDSCAAGAMAYRVLTSDTVDGYSMDLASIQPIANSYPSLCSVTVEAIEEGRAVINFDFTGVNLRADTVDGYNAGYAMFSAQLLSDLTQGWEVNNQATTEFFDSTGCTCDYVYTDSTLHTIFGCEFNVPSLLQLCEGPEAILNASDPYANYYQWTIDASNPLLDAEFSFVDIAPGMYAMQLITGNELCSDTNQFELVLAETPQIISTPEDLEACEGDSVTLMIETSGAMDQIVWSGGIINGEPFAAEATQEFTAVIENDFGCTALDTVQLIVNSAPSGAIEVVGNTYTAPDGSSWQWYLAGLPISGATAQVFVADSTTQGEISVLVTNASGCESVIVNVSEWQMNEGFMIFPNPMREGATVILPEGLFTMDLYDMSGRIIRSEQGCRSRITMERGSLSPGHYTLHIRDISRNVVMRMVVE